MERATDAVPFREFASAPMCCRGVLGTLGLPQATPRYGSSLAPKSQGVADADKATINLKSYNVVREFRGARSNVEHQTELRML